MSLKGKPFFPYARTVEETDRHEAANRRYPQVYRDTYKTEANV